MFEKCCKCYLFNFFPIVLLMVNLVVRKVTDPDCLCLLSGLLSRVGRAKKEGSRDLGRESACCGPACGCSPCEVCVVFGCVCTLVEGRVDDRLFL